MPVMIRKFPTNGPHSSEENFTPHKMYVLSLMFTRSLTSYRFKNCSPLAGNKPGNEVSDTATRFVNGSFRKLCT